MKKLRGLLVALGILTIIGSGVAAYLMWSKNAFDATLYDLWVAGRTAGFTSQRATQIIEAKNATRKAVLLVITGGAIGLFTLTAAFWGVPRKGGPVGRLEGAGA